MSEPVSVLFVCLGNICRSPSAEGVFRQVVEKAGLGEKVRIDSCGTRPELFLHYGDSSHEEVPDPYYGGDQGFETVLDLIHEASQGLLTRLRERLN